MTAIGSVDTNIVGTYIITYSTNDSIGNSASKIRTVKVMYNFKGFFPPIDKLPILNSVKQEVLYRKFNLSGDQGLDIFVTGCR